MIYLDNSATTRPFDAVIDTMADVMRTTYFNPSAPYREALAVEKRIQASRQRLERLLGAQAVIYTSGGTEANNLALLGLAQRLRGSWDFVMSAAEHPAVFMQKDALEAQGHHVLRLPLTGEGLVDLSALEGLLSERCALVSIMQVSNETGAVQPLALAASLVRKKAPQALFHVDGVQGFLRLPINLGSVGVDLYSLSGHKVHGPKGVGCLALGRDVRLAARTFGGGQEGGLRSGTEDSPAILGLDKAIETYESLPDPNGQLRTLKLRLYHALREGIPSLAVNGPPPENEEAAPHILNLSLPFVRGEVLLHALEDHGIILGTGSACSSKRGRKGGSLEAMGIPKERVDRSVRISLSPLQNIAEMDEAAAAILACHQALRPYQRR